jgi:hypothetical protein
MPLLSLAEGRSDYGAAQLSFSQNGMPANEDSPGRLRSASFSGELIQLESELIGFAVGKEIFPCHLALLVASHAAEYATQRGFDAGSNLVERGAGSDALDKRALLVAVGKGQIVREGAIGRERSRAGNSGRRFRRCPRLRTLDVDRAGVGKALQASGLYERRAYLTEIYRNALAREVYGLGYEIEQRRDSKGRNQDFEICGVSDELLEKYSVRSAQRDAAIERFTVEHGRKPTNNEVAVLVRESRADKLAEISTERSRQQQQARLLSEEGHALKNLHEESVERAGEIPNEPTQVRRGI